MEPFSAHELEYDDREDALGRWMAELHEPSGGGLTYDEWSALYLHLSGDINGIDLTTSGSQLRRVLRMHVSGIITAGELAILVSSWSGIWNQLWSGAAAHRAAVDWMGHLLAASAVGCPAWLGSHLGYYYLRLRGEALLAERSWRRQSDETGSALGDGWAFRASLSREWMCQIGWDGTDTFPRNDQLEPESREGDDDGSGAKELGWIGWRGTWLHPDQVADAAWQSAAGDRMPLVAKVAGCLTYVVFEPLTVDAGRIDGLDLITGESAQLIRSLTLLSGWKLDRTP